MERYVARRELAELMGVSESTIKRWRREGMPSETWGMSRTRRYLPSACIAWARSRAAPGGTLVDRSQGDSNADEQPQPKE
jgi:phage terminase Nu1 subunit (DNA packaging protein)